MIWTGPTASYDSSTQYFIPEHLKNDFGKIDAALRGFITEPRLAKMEKVAGKRSRKVLTVFENTHHAHNISAILRTIDAFGFLDLFFLYSNQEMRFRTADTIDRGASQWLMPKRLVSIEKCAHILQQNGYKIVLVSLPDFSRTAKHYSEKIPSFSSNQFASTAFKDFIGDKKIALIFGSELHGVSPEWQDYADAYISVEMYGFMESLNVSVCAGIILQSLREFFEKSSDNHLLSDLEKKLVIEHWIAKTCSNAYEYIANRKPELLPWFEFVRTGNFFQPTISLNDLSLKPDKL
ncbi:TrmH family RNA methyltransferase [Fluviispira vulneris]|uniref:TrmH family RNA methyltransferase n=1 Tax=Fluviispira vulneris TaxID=2763012 RepID=UPI001647815B|nr:RNA methyltransferase [Fluviispira vulneris]